MDTYYNQPDKQLVIIWGYGIGNHLSLNYLKERLDEIKKLIPSLTEEQLSDINFLPVADSSRRHKHMWYSRINVDLSDCQKDKDYLQLGKEKVYIIEGDKDESAKNCMDRMIHD